MEGGVKRGDEGKKGGKVKRGKGWVGKGLKRCKVTGTRRQGKGVTGRRRKRWEREVGVSTRVWGNFLVLFVV